LGAFEAPEEVARSGGDVSEGRVERRHDGLAPDAARDPSGFDLCRARGLRPSSVRH
jgi:hypothetical protein